jgi:hypothetical protein
MGQGASEGDVLDHGDVVFVGDGFDALGGDWGRSMT